MPRLGLVGCKAARLARINAAGVVCSRRERQQGEGPALRPVCPVPPRRRGRRGRTHPKARHASKHSAGQRVPEASAGAETLSPPHGSPGSPAPGAHHDPGSRWSDRACPAPPPARGPGSPSFLPRTLGEPVEEAWAGHTLRKAWVTWGVAGGWAAFRAGVGASGRGRGVREQRERGGGGRPRPRQVAGWRQQRWQRRLL